MNGVRNVAAAFAATASMLLGLSAPAQVAPPARPPMTWQYGYDPTGLLTTVIDPNAQTTYFHYDQLGRRIQSEQPANTGSSSPTWTDYGYDLADGLTSVTDPRSLTTTYTLNGLGRVTAQSSPDSGSATFTHDAKGNVLTSTDARGKTTTFTYDALDRVTRIGYATGTPTTFEYDGGATPTPAAAGELTRMTDVSGQTAYSYDALGRLTTKSVTIGSRTFTVRYAWGDSGSALDKPVAITYPSGTRVDYSYDSAGSVSAIAVTPVSSDGQGFSGTALPLLGGITYNAENRVAGWLWSDGKARSIGYDGFGLVSSYTLGDPAGSGSAAGVLRTLQRDAAGRITAFTHTNNGNPVTAFDQRFGYDNLDRLVAVTQATSAAQYGYDDTGNRTVRGLTAASYTNTVSATSNRLTQVQDGSGTASITHDAAGHIVADGRNTYSYTDRGRMASAVTAGGTVAYVYNGLGQRARKSGPTAVVPTGASHFVYDEGGQLLGEYDANGYPVYETVYLASTPVGVVKHTGSAATNNLAAVVYNVYADHIDTPRMITAQDHSIVWRWDTAEAFGATGPEENPNGAGRFVYNQRFPGQVFDAETGLFQNWNREYEPRTGRYAQSDPIGLAGGINTFAYVGANPLSFVDPWGLVKIPGVPGADGETTVHANPGPDATDFRPEHQPDHVHLGANDGPRVRTSDFKPLSEDDARRMSRKQKKFCESLAEESKNKIRKAQSSIFKHGRIILQIGGGATSIAAACRADPVWCAEQIEAGNLP